MCKDREIMGTFYRNKFRKKRYIKRNNGLKVIFKSESNKRWLISDATSGDRSDITNLIGWSNARTWVRLGYFCEQNSITIMGQVALYLQTGHSAKSQT